MSNFAVTGIIVPVFAFVVFTFGSSLTLTGDTIVEAKFRGEWVPAKAACTSPLKLKIDSSKVTFINGADQEEYNKLDQCFSCMGKDIQNIVWLTTDAQGDSPFVIYLDSSKKKAAVSVDFSNDKKLGKRFPFGTAPLRKCISSQ